MLFFLPVPHAAETTDTSAVAVPQSAGTTETPAPAASQSAVLTVTSLSALGDLSAFITIEQDTLALVNKGDLSGVKTRVNDLETAWDQAQDILQPKDTAKWTQIDGTIDQVLSALRAPKPDRAACKSTLEASIAAMGAK